MKKINKFIALVLFIVLTLPSSSLAAMEKYEDKAKGYIVGEVSSNTIIESYNEDEVVPIASITKLMTYILTQDSIEEGKIKLVDKVVITDDIQAVYGSSLNLAVGQEPTIDELIKGLVVISGNDAAYALAKTISGSEEEFVKLMNKKAKEIGLKSAKFINASGLPNELDEENTMSVKDVFNMARYAVDKYPQIIEISSIQVLDIPNLNFKRESTLPFLKTIPGVDGLKTGTTDAAGNCLISTFKPLENEKTKDLRFISVVMGSESKDMRNEITEGIINYISSNITYSRIADEKEIYDELKLNKVKKGYIDIYPEKNFEALYDINDGIKIEEKINEDIKLPLSEGDAVGVLSIKANNGKVYDVDLIVKEDYDKSGVMTRLKRLLSNMINTSAVLLGF